MVSWSLFLNSKWDCLAPFFRCDACDHTRLYFCREFNCDKYTSLHVNMPNKRKHLQNRARKIKICRLTLRNRIKFTTFSHASLVMVSVLVLVLVVIERTQWVHSWIAASLQNLLLIYAWSQCVLIEPVVSSQSFWFLISRVYFCLLIRRCPWTCISNFTVAVVVRCCSLQIFTGNLLIE